MQTYMPLQLPDVLGRDLAGEVTELGDGVTRFKKGDRVMGLTKKTYAEFCVAKVEELALIPDGMDYEQAAAVPLVTLTGTQLIEKAIGIRSGQTVLVTGALGGVGRTAVFVAKTHGAKVLAGVRESQKKEAAELGADGIVALVNDQEISKLHDLDAIADTVGGETIAKLFGALRKGGTIGSVLGPVKGAEEADIQVKPMSALPDAARLSQLAADVAKGAFTIPISKRFPLREAAEAQKLAEKGGAGGKILLIP
jgi:NADPH:quinone reductase-like Zn-dependent oxidoreductase